MSEIFNGDRFGDLAQQVDRWLEEFAADTPMIAAIDRGTSDDTLLGEPRWFVRMIGEDKDFITVWLTLGQRTLRYETYVMPAPEENERAVFEYVMRCNDQLNGAHFSLGAEDAIYLRGAIPDGAIGDAELDRILGTVYATVESHFQNLLRIGFASRFRSG